MASKFVEPPILNIIDCDLDSWKNSMVSLLEKNGILYTIDKNLFELDKTNKFKKKDNSHAINLILNYVDESIGETIVEADFAHEMWNLTLENFKNMFVANHAALKKKEEEELMRISKKAAEEKSKKIQEGNDNKEEAKASCNDEGKAKLNEKEDRGPTIFEKGECSKKTDNPEKVILFQKLNSESCSKNRDDLCDDLANLSEYELRVMYDKVRRKIYSRDLEILDLTMKVEALEIKNEEHVKQSQEMIVNEKSTHSSR